MKKGIFDTNTQEIEKVIEKIRTIREKNRGDFMKVREKSKPHYAKLKSLKEANMGILKRKIKNKNFYFKPVKTSTSIYGGRNFKADIFMNTKKGLKKVSQAKWNTASYRGEDSEVLNQLVRDKILPKELLTASRSTSSGGGYYGWEIKELTGLNIKAL